MTPVQYAVVLKEVRRRNPTGGDAGDSRDCVLFGETWEGHGVRLTLSEWDALNNPGIVVVTVQPHESVKP